MNSIIKVLSTLVLIFLFFTGCGQQKPEDSYNGHDDSKAHHAQNETHE